jgi:hypothetical protein
MHAKQIIEKYAAPEATFEHPAILISINRSATELARTIGGQPSPHDLLTRLVLPSGQPSAKQLVQQPDSIGVDYILLAVGSNLGYPPLTHELLDLSAINAAGFPGEAQHPADLVQRRLGPAKRREHITKVYCIIGVSVEIRAIGEARSRDAVEHRPVAQDWQVKPIPIERNQSRL